MPKPWGDTGPPTLTHTQWTDSKRQVRMGSIKDQIFLKALDKLK